MISIQKRVDRATSREGEYLRAGLIGLPPIDPVASGGAVLLLMGVLVIASIVPARRAARLDPMQALRAE